MRVAKRVRPGALAERLRPGPVAGLALPRPHGLGLASHLLRRVVPRGGSPPQESAAWLCRVLIGDPWAHILIAGNRESSSPGIGRWAEEYLLEVFARALEV
jgi:hypothetical protein